MPDTTVLTIDDKRGRDRSLEPLRAVPREILNSDAVAFVHEESVLETVPECDTGGKLLEEVREEDFAVFRSVSVIDENILCMSED